ncbi:MAG: PEP-CTERM sorting domain-containing protein [Azoarcus sp.]|nr:PEP-CTERM sorting domain-containing protein [Azoarcus sp.]
MARLVEIAFIGSEAWGESHTIKKVSHERNPPPADGLACHHFPAFVSSVHAAPVAWTDWTSVNLAAGQASGTLTIDGTAVAVTLSNTSPFTGRTTVNDDSPFWTYPDTYINSAVDNAPTGDLISLNQDGTITITFDQTVRDPILALVSWNRNHVQFAEGMQIEYLSSGSGPWGTGSFANQTETSFDGVGDLHGTIRLLGDYDSISFTHTPENSHEFTLGVLGLAPAVPEPDAYAMLLAGLGLMGVMARRQRKV